VGLSMDIAGRAWGVTRLQWQNQYDRQLRSALQRLRDRRGQDSGRPEPGGSFRGGTRRGRGNKGQPEYLTPEAVHCRSILSASACRHHAHGIKRGGARLVCSYRTRAQLSKL
jgi:hypothetical protein